MENQDNVLDNIDENAVLRYDEELFVLIDNVNANSVIPEFCRAIFKYNLSENEADIQNELFEYDKDLEELLNRFPRPFTIVQELYHIDRCYRDTYYTYFSNQHFQVKRYSRRLSFFAGSLNEDIFFSADGEVKKRIENSFMGSCVINPCSFVVISRYASGKYYSTIIQTNVYGCSRCGSDCQVYSSS